MNSPQQNPEGRRKKLKRYRETGGRTEGIKKEYRMKGNEKRIPGAVSRNPGDNFL
jgi:hypothetical protein